MGIIYGMILLYKASKGKDTADLKKIIKNYKTKDYILMSGMAFV